MTRPFLAIVLSLAVSACGPPAARRAQPATDQAKTNATATPATSSAPSPSADATPARTLVVVQVTDENGLHPEGIPILIEEPSRGVLFTDADGEIELTRPAVYKLRVLDGCHERVDVLGGGYATLGVPPGDTKRRTLPVQWRHRFGPSDPVEPDRTGDWPVGTNVKLRFDVLDHCDEKRAPRATFPTFAYTHSSHLEIVGQPLLASDGDGHGSVTVRCKTAGEPKLVLKDTENPSDALDLVGGAVGYGGVPRCVDRS